MLVETESLSWRVWRWFSPGLLELTAWTKISWCALTFKLKFCNSLRRSPIYFGIKSLQILQNLEHSSHRNWQRLCSENGITWSPPFFFWRSYNSSKISLLKIGSRLSIIGSNQSKLEGQSIIDVFLCSGVSVVFSPTPYSRFTLYQLSQFVAKLKWATWNNTNSTFLHFKFSW